MVSPNPNQKHEHAAHVIPKWLEGSLSKDGTKAIEQAIYAAEKRTSGEIVPVIVQSSTVNATAPLFAVFIAGFIVLAVKHGLWLYESPVSEHPWLWYVLFLIAAGLGIAFGRSRSGQIYLTPSWERRRQVHQRAMLAFYQSGLNQTSGRTGILLFMSWREHQAIVLADEGIAKHCDAKTFEDVVSRLVSGAKEGKLSEGFCQAIGLSADILTKHLPLLPGDVNELHDTLRIID